MKVFIAGPRAIKTLNENVKERLNNIMNNNFSILVGDANGIDKQIQYYCHAIHYNNVKIFASNGKARNNIGKWDVENVEVNSKVSGFDYYAAKDLEMARQANCGFMIWNGKSKGTKNNMVNLVSMNKQVLVYLTTEQTFYTVKTLRDIDALENGIKTQEKGTSTETFNPTNEYEQISLF